jgi:hypothetical protein
VRTRVPKINLAGKRKRKNMNPFIHLKLQRTFQPFLNGLISMIVTTTFTNHAGLTTRWPRTLAIAQRARG